jgi:hypothetical protein
MKFIRAVALAIILAPASWLLAPAYAQSPGNFSTLSTTGTATLGGDALACSGHPWLDVKCPSNAGGAVGDGSHDDTAALAAAINTSVTNNWPVHIPAGTYKAGNDRLCRPGGRRLPPHFGGRDDRRPHDRLRPRPAGPVRRRHRR